MEKVLLISLQGNLDVIGLKYIHSYLIENGVDSSILFAPQYQSEEFSAIKEFLTVLNPKIIGISLMSPEFSIVRQISLDIKKNFPEIILIWGGVHPSIDPKGCLNYADYVFVGEAENAFFEFVTEISEDKPVIHIKNLGYKISNEIHLNEIRPPNENLNFLPFPEHLPQKSFILHNGKVTNLNRNLLMRYARYSGKFYNIITSRGCPFSCTYCCNSFFSKLYGKKIIRKRSVDNIIEELKQAIKQFPEIFFVNIQDDNFFSYDLKWMKEFSERYKKEIKKNFICRGTPNLLNEEKIKILKEAGLSSIKMGLQSGSQRVNSEIYKRYISSEKFIEATKLIKKYKIPGYYDIILDNPYETEEDIIQTINVVLKIPKPFEFVLFSLCFYQGTELYERALKEGKSFEDPTEKNYGKYSGTFLNKVIRLCPLVPRMLIIFLVKNRDSSWAHILLNGVNIFAIIIIEPLVWFRLTLNSVKNRNFFGSLGMMMIFFKGKFFWVISPFRKFGWCYFGP